MKGKINILFFLYRSKVNRKECMPIYCRITLDGHRKQFSCDCSLKATDWDSKNSKHKGLSTEAKHLNERLRSIKRKILRSYDLLAKTHAAFDINHLYDQFSGIASEVKTLLGVFDLHIAQIEELIGKDYSKATHSKFLLIRSHVSEFINEYYQQKDVPLSQLKLGFLQDLDHFLKLRKKQNQNTINKTIERVKKIVKIAVAHGWLRYDPFALYRKKRFVKEVVFLDKEELSLLENHQLSKKLETVRNIFFSLVTQDWPTMRYRS